MFFLHGQDRRLIASLHRIQNTAGRKGLRAGFDHWARGKFPTQAGRCSAARTSRGRRGSLMARRAMCISHAQSDWGHVHAELLRRSGVTLSLLWDACST